VTVHPQTRGSGRLQNAWLAALGYGVGNASDPMLPFCRIMGRIPEGGEP